MSKKTALITGIAGQDGAYLADFLLKKNYQIIGVTPLIESKHLWRLDYFGILDRVKIIEGNITDRDLIEKIIKDEPDEFYNLAGQSSVAKSWEDPAATLKVNGLAVWQILEAMRSHSPKIRFFQASSAEIFGNTKSVITENSANFNPLNPYGIAKLTAHLAVKNFRAQYGLFACSGILFNHESPLRISLSVTKTIANGVAKISLGLADKVPLGNIAIVRDWGFAGDTVEAMWLMLKQRHAKDLVICTGKSRPIKDFVKEAFAYAGINNWHKYVEIEPALMRKYDVVEMRGSNKKIKKLLGWRPKTNFKRLVRIMVDYELEKLKINDYRR